MDIEEFGEIIRERRAELGLSQEALARESGFTRRSIIYWENGENEINLTNAVKLLKALHIDLRDLGE